MFTDDDEGRRQWISLIVAGCGTKTTLLFMSEKHENADNTVKNRLVLGLQVQR